MPQHLAHVALVVPDYDEAITYFTRVLGFTLVEDVHQPELDKRWVVVKPSEEGSASLVLAQASDDEQRTVIGDQTGGRVFLFLATDDFKRDHQLYLSRGVEFLEAPRSEPYGTVAQFKDCYGNKWDLVEYT